MKRNRRGFTMIELLVVATIIAVLSAVGVVSFSRANIRARDGKRKADLEQVRSALELYRSDMGYYPAVAAGSLVSALNTGGYLNSTTVADPQTGTAYTYCSSQTSGGACLTGGQTTAKFYYVQATLENTSDPACSGVPCLYTLNNP